VCSSASVVGVISRLLSLTILRAGFELPCELSTLTVVETGLTLNHACIAGKTIFITVFGQRFNQPVDRKMINSRSTLAAARPSRFLTGLEQPATQAILAAAQIRRISAKHDITSGGHRATHFFLVQSGRVRFYHLTKQGESVLLAWLVPGDVIGLVALLKSPLVYMASTEASSDCELLTWERSVIRRLAGRYPLLSENGLHIALGYLRNYIDRHIGLVTKTAEERLAATLLRLGDQSNEVHPNGIEIRATNDQLGALADISPFTVSRVLRKWVRAGILAKGRGRVLLYAPEALLID
jgi:CRP-like cAMP-binding protein